MFFFQVKSYLPLVFNFQSSSPSSFFHVLLYKLDLTSCVNTLEFGIMSKTPLPIMWECKIDFLVVIEVLYVLAFSLKMVFQLGLGTKI